MPRVNVRAMRGCSWQSCLGVAAPPGPPPAPPPQYMELKLNVTDSQLVLVEDPSVWDTNAVILRVRGQLTPWGAIQGS